MLNFASIMAQKAAGLRIDPFCNYNFLVEIDGIVSGAFSEVSGLTIETETEEKREGGVNDYVHILPKGTKYGHLVLSKGLSDLDLFWSWYKNVISGTIERKDGMIMLFDSAMDLAMWWYFYGAYPIKWEGPTLHAYNETLVAVEKITLAHHGLTKPDASQAWSASRILLKGSGILSAVGSVESAVAEKVEQTREQYVDSYVEEVKETVESVGDKVADKIENVDLGKDSPKITKHPETQNKNEGESVTLSVVVEGTGPFTYQWKKDGTNITSANSSTYTISSLKSGDTGSYICFVSNDFGSATSNAGVLTVLAMNKPPAITTHPLTQDKALGDDVTFEVEATGTEPLSYQWQKDWADVSVTATQKSYTIQGLKQTDEGNYRCVVTNQFGTASSNNATLTIGAKPVIKTHPQAQTKKETESVTFTVQAEGVPPLSYQWQRNGKDLSGATLASYTIARAVSGDQGDYSCIVKNRFGQVVSNSATLTVTNQ